MTYLKACINGARTPDQHPNLPVTPDQLAEAAVAAHRAGAKAVHMHPKTADGVDSLQPQVVAAAVDAVRHAVPGSAARRDDGLLGAVGSRRAAAHGAELDRVARLRVGELARARLGAAGAPVAADGRRCRGRHLPCRGGGVVGDVGDGRALHAGDGRTRSRRRHRSRRRRAQRRCWRSAHRPRCCCTVWTKAVGRCWNTRARAACRRGSGSRTPC